MIGIPVDISTPEVNTIDVESIKVFEKIFENSQDLFVKVSFKVDVENLIDSTMVQLYPVDFAKNMCKVFMINKGETV
ncbi:MAG: flagellar motor switch phosphatase FliY, partial [Lachnospiraceae bacterium]|nr:flagellar motor switch phosphatase FliY [Lachnospiraceae bacterium]